MLLPENHQKASTLKGGLDGWRTEVRSNISFHFASHICTVYSKNKFLERKMFKNSKASALLQRVSFKPAFTLAAASPNLSVAVCSFALLKFINLLSSLRHKRPSILIDQKWENWVRGYLILQMTVEEKVESSHPLTTVLPSPAQYQLSELHLLFGGKLMLGNRPKRVPYLHERGKVPGQRVAPKPLNSQK